VRIKFRNTSNLIGCFKNKSVNITLCLSLCAIVENKSSVGNISIRCGPRDEREGNTGIMNGKNVTVHKPDTTVLLTVRLQTSKVEPASSTHSKAAVTFKFIVQMSIQAQINMRGTSAGKHTVQTV
jgi:uncharacterized protein YraI